jgi:hypothetical protein
MPRASKPLYEPPTMKMSLARMGLTAVSTQRDRFSWIMFGDPIPADRLDAKCEITNAVIAALATIHERFLYEDYDLSYKPDVEALLKAAQLKLDFADQLTLNIQNEVEKLQDILAAFANESPTDVMNNMVQLRREIETLEAQLPTALGNDYTSLKSVIEMKQKEELTLSHRLTELFAANVKQPSPKLEAPKVEPAAREQPPHAKVEYKRNATFGDMNGPSSHKPWLIVKKPKIEDGKAESKRARQSKVFRPLPFTPVANKMLDDYPTLNYVEVVEDPHLCLALYFAGVAFGAVHGSPKNERYTRGRKTPSDTVRVINSSTVMRIGVADVKQLYVALCPDWRKPEEYKHVFIYGHMAQENVDEWESNGGRILTVEDCMPFIEPYMAHARTVCIEQTKGKPEMAPIMAWKFIRFNTPKGVMPCDKHLEMLGKAPMQHSGEEEKEEEEEEEQELQA